LPRVQLLVHGNAHTNQKWIPRCTGKLLRFQHFLRLLLFGGGAIPIIPQAANTDANNQMEEGVKESAADSSAGAKVQSFREGGSYVQFILLHLDGRMQSLG